MRVYHATSADAAGAILAGGFRDATGYFLTRQLHTGVWVADQPLDENEGATSENLLTLDVPDADLELYEWVEEGKGYREFLVPAEILNRHAVAIVDADEPRVSGPG